MTKFMDLDGFSQSMRISSALDEELGYDGIRSFWDEDVELRFTEEDGVLEVVGRKSAWDAPAIKKFGYEITAWELKE